MNIYLIRHGETDWNTEQRFQGMADIPLNARGFRQAEWIGHRFMSISIHHLFSSDLSRALQTALAVSRSTQIPVIPLYDLREIHVGDWQGYTWSEVKAQFPNHSTHRDPTSLDDASHHGESIRQFYNRVVRGMEYILSHTNGEDVAIVTHGGTIRMILCYLLKTPLDERDIYKISNVGLFHLKTTIKGSYELILNDDTSHVPTDQPALVGDDRNV
jgi:broad specificity phosphatase PhoE